MEDLRIRRVSAKIASGERRAAYLRRRIDDERLPESSRDFDRAELGFVESALMLFKRYRSESEPDTHPVMVLSEMRDAIEELSLIDDSPMFDRLHAAMARARRTLEQFDES